MNDPSPSISVFPDPKAVIEAAASHIESLATPYVSSKGRFVLALSGGSTPRALYARLAAEPFAGRMPWSSIHLFWGDERYVAMDHPESNYRMVAEALLSKVKIPPANIHPIPVQRGTPEDVAAIYEQELRAFFELAQDEFPRFDLVLLGLGEDGHTASLFPQSPVLSETKRLVRAVFVEPSGARITLTLPVLNKASNIVFVVTGSSKAGIVAQVLSPERRIDPLPAQRIQPANGNLIWMVDKAAASKLRKAD